MDHIQTLNEVMERTNEYELPLCLGFIDFEKAFDSVSLSAVLKSLEHQGIESAYIKLLRNIYSTATSVIRLHQDSEKFKVGKGVRQGDSISPKLFCAVLERVFQNLNWDEVGIKINGEYLHHLRFADDIVLFASSAEELQTRMEELSNESSKIGLKMNLSKTKVMYNQHAAKKEVKINGETIGIVDEYVYLGQLKTSNAKLTDEINRRCKMAWSSFGRLHFIFKSKLSICLKRKVYNQCVLPVMMYGCETWTLNAQTTQRLRVTQRAMERCMLGITRRDRKRNEWIRAQTKVEDVIKTAKKMKWRWAGHIARRTDGRWTTNVLQWIPREKKRPRRRPNVRWVDEIKRFSGATWMRISADRDMWKEKGEAFIQQWIENG